jgi:hypothetical protein
LYVPFCLLSIQYLPFFHVFIYDLQHKQLIQHFSRFKGKKKERERPKFGLITLLKM